MTSKYGRASSTQSDDTQHKGEKVEVYTLNLTISLWKMAFQTILEDMPKTGK